MKKSGRNSPAGVFLFQQFLLRDFVGLGRTCPPAMACSDHVLTSVCVLVLQGAEKRKGVRAIGEGGYSQILVEEAFLVDFAGEAQDDLRGKVSASRISLEVCEVARNLLEFCFHLARRLRQNLNKKVEKIEKRRKTDWIFINIYPSHVKVSSLLEKV